MNSVNHLQHPNGNNKPIEIIRPKPRRVNGGPNDPRGSPEEMVTHRPNTPLCPIRRDMGGSAPALTNLKTLVSASSRDILYPVKVENRSSPVKLALAALRATPVSKLFKPSGRESVTSAKSDTPVSSRTHFWELIARTPVGCVSDSPPPPPSHPPPPLPHPKSDMKFTRSSPAISQTSAPQLPSRVSPIKPLAPPVKPIRQSCSPPVSSPPPVPAIREDDEQGARLEKASSASTTECGSLSKSSSDGDHISSRRKIWSKLKSRKRGQTPIPLPSATVLADPIYHQVFGVEPNATQVLSTNLRSGIYGGSSSDENRSSGHATMSDARSSYISSSPTEEYDDNLRALIKDKCGSTFHSHENFGSKASVKRNGQSARRRAAGNHLRRVNADDNLLATIIAEEGHGASDVQHIRHAMEQLQLRAPSAANGYSTTTSTYSSISGTGSESEPGIRRLIRHSSLETLNTAVTQADEFVWLDSHSRLVELQHLPWSNHDILRVLQQGRLKTFLERVSMEAVPRLSYLLQRPFVRISREAQRFSRSLGMCSKQELISAIKVVLSSSLADSCIKSGHRAAAMFAVNGDTLKQSKSVRAGLQLSVGKFCRWMIDVNLGTFVNEFAAIYLTAAIENLLEEMILLCLSIDNDSIITIELLEACVANSPELWGLLQPYAHLNSGRTATGALALPLSPSSSTLARLESPHTSANLSSSSSSSSSSQIKESVPHPTGSPSKQSIEQNLLTTCVGSLQELGDILTRVVQYFNQSTRSATGSGAAGSGSKGSRTPVGVTFGPGALHSLFYFMRCAQLSVNCTQGSNHGSGSQELVYERPYLVLPPLIEWVRVSAAHAEYRRSTIIDKDDVMQSARLLLPGVDCPFREYTGMASEEWLFKEKNECSRKLKTDLAFRMLSCGRTDLVASALSLLPSTFGVNAMNEQGLNPLMMACLRGDEAMVHMLLDAGANVEVEVPVPGPFSSSSQDPYPYVNHEIQYWTPLTFASIHNHISITKLLLEKGANVEGGSRLNEERVTQTPLQLASAAGFVDMVNLLLAYGAHPFLSTSASDAMSYSPLKGCHSAVAVAAGHGQRMVLRTLLAHPLATRNKDVLSLEEILAEGRNTLKSDRGVGGHRIQVVQVPVNQERPGNCPANAGTVATMSPDGTQLIHLTKTQLKALQEAMYHSAENGHIEITLDLRNIGVPWTLHTWMQTLATAHEMRLDAITDQLLQDFLHLWPDDCSSQFVDECLPLLFSIFRHSKNEGTSLLLADIFSTCYGKEPVNAINNVSLSGGTRIDPKYVNSPEMSDVQFRVEGKLFYAHKIILVNASPRFQSMLTPKAEAGQSNATPILQVNEMRYDIFQLVMAFLYNGGWYDFDVEQNDILDLMAAANYFQLDGLLRFCESCCSKLIDLDNVVSVYIHAKVYNAVHLLEYCQGFILQQLVALLTYDDSLRKLLFGKRIHNYDVLSGILFTLQNRIRERCQQSKGHFRPSPVSPVAGPPRNQHFMANNRPTGVSSANQLIL